MFVAGLMRDHCGINGLTDITPRACSAAIANDAAVMAMSRPIIAAKARNAVSRSSVVADAGSSVTEPMLDNDRVP